MNQKKVLGKLVLAIAKDPSVVATRSAITEHGGSTPSISAAWVSIARI